MAFSTILEAVEHWAKHSPQKMCLIEAKTGQKISYGEFWQAALAFAEKLKSNGLQKGGRVVVRVGPLIETFVAQFGIYLYGGVYCPVEMHMKDLKLLEMLEYFESDLLISAEKIDFNGRWIDLLTVCCGNDVPTAEFDFPDPEDMCSIVFTTGTTGKAKGVMINHKTCFLHSATSHNVYNNLENDVFLWSFPLDRVGGIRLFGSSFLIGATVVYSSGVVFVKDFFDVLDEYNVSVIYLDPFSLSILLGSDANTFTKYTDQLKALSLSGSMILETHKQQICSLLPKTRLFSFYSSTEISNITSYEFSRYPDLENCVGKPIPNTKIYILNDDGDPMETTSKDNIGVISCENERMMMGYWKDPELTGSVLNNGRIVMTDVGYIDDDGYLYIMGRRDDVIVTGGHKVAPYEIENIAMKMPGISECACIPVKNDILGNVPNLFVVMKANYEFSANEIYKFLAQRLETFKLPRVIRQLDCLPKLGLAQKIDRRALKEYE